MSLPVALGLVFVVVGVAFALVAVAIQIRRMRHGDGQWPTDDDRTPAQRAADARAAVERALRLADDGVAPDPATAEERARLTRVFEMLSGVREIPIPDRVRRALDHLTPDELRDVIADTLGLARFEDESQRRRRRPSRARKSDPSV